MVAIPNNMLDMMTDYDTAREWVHKNVSAYNFGGGVNIRYVAVGNEPFLSSLNGTFLNVTLPALQNIQKALDEAGVGDTIKATVPLNADVYQSPKDTPVPSAGRFRPEISGLMTEIVQFLNQSGAPFTVNIYPGLFRKLAGNAGTPLRPNQYIEIYLFSLIDEDVKSIDPGNFERHWGMMRYDGQPKYAMDPTGQGRNTALVGARGVEYLPRVWCVLNANAGNMSRLADNVGYACTYADCTSLGYGSTCNGMDAAGNASYAFNAYFQVQDQDEEACGFDGLAVRTRQDPSTGTCNFTIQLKTTSAAAGRPTVLFTTALLALVLAAMVTML
ncbi:Glucan endo-1,3-beta-glucosidase 8 [Triticum urartu]|uniref:Glucan endo-1,3-beta-glucosidase 8 n=1 Tax=Triticum urartu TaxID=4572 RepID=M7ZYW1_TRIUA|nr:Glucan endo-1,3-beta-glucosidase 8 [Triticum urartu]